MERKYYLAPHQKVALTILLVFDGLLFLLGLLIIFFSLILKATPLIKLVAITFVVMQPLALAALIWRIVTPFLEVGDQGVKFNIPFYFPKETIPWNRILAITEERILINGKLLKIHLRTEAGQFRELCLNLNAIEKPDEIIALLREKITPASPQQLLSLIGHSSSTHSEVKCGKYKLNDYGIITSGLVIPWEKITAVKYAGMVIAGYGKITITYQDINGRLKTLGISPQISPNYQDFAARLVHSLPNAELDPGLLQLFRLSPQKARLEQLSVFMFIFSLVCGLLVLPPLLQYSLTKAASLALTAGSVFGLVLLLVYMFLILNKFRTQKVSSTLMLFIGSLTTASFLTGLFAFFSYSPLSLTLIKGDFAIKQQDSNLAEACYREVLAAYPDNHNLFFPMAKVCLMKEDYGQALHYLSALYEKHPKKWNADAVRLIPETLIRMNEYEQALDWCDRILNDYPQDPQVQRVILKIRRSI
jgi:tetratricopeptide (TPR) repeat protein